MKYRVSGKSLSGLVLKAMDIEPKYLTTIFALGRIMGWVSLIG